MSDYGKWESQRSRDVRTSDTPLHLSELLLWSNQSAVSSLAVFRAEATLIFHLVLGLPTNFFPRASHTRILYVFLVSPITRSTLSFHHNLLHSVILTRLSYLCKSLDFLYVNFSIPCYLITVLKIFCMTLLSKTYHRPSLLTAKDSVSQTS
jgi:hypothetical protein